MKETAEVSRKLSPGTTAPLPPTPLVPEARSELAAYARSGTDLRPCANSIRDVRYLPRTVCYNHTRCPVLT
eukprot:2251387-Rhodomonas_salina.2